MVLPLVRVPASNSGTRRFASPRCRVDVFERKLRNALQVDSIRPCGAPGTSPRPSNNSVRSFAVEYLIDVMMTKYDDGKAGSEKADTALRKFMEAEEVCFFRNLYFAQDNYWLDTTEPALNKARQLIADLIGEQVDLERFARGFGWGPGSSTRLPRKWGDACYKYSGIPECTPNAYVLCETAIAAHPMWKHTALNEGGPRTTWGSKMLTVPKNYKTDRTICVEPDLNMYVQKGIGAYIRQKLRKVGIDLSSQEPNRNGARDASLATIDFSMASDSVSQGLVRYLLPPAWVDLITQTRSEFTVLPDKTLHRLSKVSSMGNGFTFELETLIFWSLAAAIVPKEDRHRILVYGDDVLIPVEHAADYIELCRKAGFSTNVEKTFVDGPFRESCGIHIHSGFDVTPFYIRRPVDTLPELFLLHNNLRRWRDRVDPLLSRGQYEAVTKLMAELRRLAPAKWRKPRLPDGYGDGAFIGSFAEVCPALHKDKSGLTGWEYFSVSVFEEVVNDDLECEVPGLMIKALTKVRRDEILPGIFERTSRVPPSSGGALRVKKIDLPWAAFG